jgi:hypothetical protein
VSDGNLIPPVQMCISFRVGRCISKYECSAGWSYIGPDGVKRCKINGNSRMPRRG